MRKNVTFYFVINGHSEIFGVGTEITMKNGNTYALIGSDLYLIVSDDTNTSYKKV